MTSSSVIHWDNKVNKRVLSLVLGTSESKFLWSKDLGFFFFPFSKIKYPEVDNQPVAYFLKVIKGSLLAHIFAFKSENNC